MEVVEWLGEEGWWRTAEEKGKGCVGLAAFARQAQCHPVAAAMSRATGSSLGPVNEESEIRVSFFVSNTATLHSACHLRRP